MIILRGKSVQPKPLTLTQIGEVYDSMLAYATATNLLEPITLRHFLRIVAISIKPNFPDATIDKLADELIDALAPGDFRAIEIAIFDESYYEATKRYARPAEIGHG